MKLHCLFLKSACLPTLSALFLLSLAAPYAVTQAKTQANTQSDTQSNPVPAVSMDKGGNTAPVNEEASASTPAATSLETSGSEGYQPVRGRVRPAARGPMGPFSRIAIGVKMGSMGAGLEIAVPLPHSISLRPMGNFFKYTHNLTQDGVDYSGTIHLRSFQIAADWFPFHNGFHISPQYYVHAANSVNGGASVAGGQIFTLNNTDYRSSMSDPIHGSGKVTVNDSGPGLTVGWGSLLPRNRRHFSFPFEIGAIYEGSPKILLNLAGSACDSSGINCGSVNTDPSFQENLVAEQVKLNKDAQPYKFYPIISTGFAVNF